MPFLQANDIKLHYWHIGSGPDIILLHGLSGNLAIWHFTLLPRLRHAYRVSMYDLRGHGRSDVPKSGYTTRDMAQDLLGLMNALNIEKTHLMGHSLGADIALHFAILHPERVNKIIALEAGIAALVELRKQKDWAGWAEFAHALEKYGGITVPKEKWHDVDYMLRKSLEVPIVFGPAKGLPRKKEPLLRLLDETTLVQEYENPSGMTLEAIAQIQHPVLLVYGEESTYLGTYEILKKTLPNCTPLLLKDSKHFGVLEQTDILGDHIQRFLGTDSTEAEA